MNCDSGFGGGVTCNPDSWALIVVSVLVIVGLIYFFTRDAEKFS